MLAKFVVPLLCLCAGTAYAQDSGALQVHGFATQSVLFSSYNNYLVPKASDGDAGWTEAVVTLNSSPIPKLRVGLQLHYFRLGDLGDDAPMIDWAMGDYRVNKQFGIRAGKIKTPLGLFNDLQDIDAVYLWSLLPQSTYQLDNRSFFLAHLGGEIYGSQSLGVHGGQLSYRVYGGSNTLSSNGGVVERIKDGTGLEFSSPPSGPLYGVDLRYQTPWKPLLLGASFLEVSFDGRAPNGTGAVKGSIPAYYAQFDNNKYYLAGEYRRQTSHLNLVLQGYPVQTGDDERQWYVMAAYRPSDKLQLGTYYSRSDVAGSTASYQANNSRDFVQSARFDFNQNIYVKAENHFLHGTELSFYPDDNLALLRPRTDVVIGKVGFTF